MDWIERLWRQLTDRPVQCDRCRMPLGYVILRGHRRWHCGRCSESGEVSAVC